MARYYTCTEDVAGGVHVRLAPYDQRIVDIRFMGSDGLNLTRDQERAIERVFFREDYRRAYLEDIGNIEYANNAPEVYGKGYLRNLDAEVIHKARFKIIADFAHSPAADVLPDLLDRLGVETVPLNARVDPNKVAITMEEFRAARAQLARITKALDNISLGIRLDVGGEKLFIADDTGVTVSDPVMCLAMATLVFRTYPGATVVVSVDQPSVYEDVAAQYGGHVIRCQVDTQALMQAAKQDGVIMAGDGTGNFVFPALHPAIDGLFAAGKLLELLARQEIKLSRLIAELPPFFAASHDVEGQWDSKGRVMRSLIEQFSRLRTETMDGIKIHVGEREWVLIRPDNETAAFHLTAEAPTLQAAQELVADYGGIVHRIVQDTTLRESEASAL